MPYGTGAGGLLGVALETVSGTYLAPTKFVPINSENLHVVEDTQWRRPIRESADIIGAVAGNEHAEGDLEMESLEDCIVYFLLAARANVVKTGTTPNFTYTFTPSSIAIPTRTLSITIKRSEQIFGYTGCIVGSFKFGINNGLLTFGVSIIARSEATQSSPTATWPTSTPFGAGTYEVEIPTGTPVIDTDTFEWTREDNGEPQFRLKNSGRGAQFNKFGEGETSFTMSRDFLTRADYDLFKAIAAQSISITASKGVNNEISILTPVTFKETYEVGLSGQGDLLMASVGYRAAIDATGKSYEIALKTQEDITLA
jgi:hypothetical protein